MLGIPADSFLFPLLLIAVVRQDLKSGQKLLELHFPVENDGCGNDDEVLTPHASIAGKMTEQRDSLDGFPECQQQLE